MKLAKVFVSFCALGLVSLSASAALENMEVNGKLVTKATQEEFLAGMVKNGATRNAELEDRVRYMFVRDTALLQEAKKDGIEKQKAVQEAIEKAKNGVLVQAYLEQWAKKNPVSDKEVRIRYQDEKDAWGKEEVAVRHILVKDEAKAKDLLNRIKKGENFEKLARENSIDTEQNKKAGGLIEWTSPNVFDKEFQAGFKGLGVGKLNPLPVKTRLGWHVVRLEGKRKAQRWTDFSTVKDALKNLMMQEKLQAYMDSITKSAKVVKK